MVLRKTLNESLKIIGALWVTFDPHTHPLDFLIKLKSTLVCDRLYEKGPFGIKVQFPIIAREV